MPTYNGWTIITMPDTPTSPATIEFSQIDAVAINVSPFTGQQQVQNWNATWMEASITLPPMSQSEAQPWVTFLRNLQGVANVFQFNSEFSTAYSNDVGSLYWRLKGNLRKWMVGKDRYYIIQFEVRQAF